MRLRSLAAMLVFALLVGRDAWAHRIDEYLQATMLSLKADEVDGTMRLIPGMLVAPGVIASIDRDGDGVFSDGEQRAYAQRVVGDLSITVDGVGVLPRLIAWNFPSAAQMREGLGEIRIEYRGALPAMGPRRTLVLRNTHRNAGSVYLMNVLVPEDRGLRVVRQRRNDTQSEYEVDYERGAGEFEQSRDSGAGSFQGLFRLGMRHIAEGADHLLFLLVLLLPAPLVVVGSRWGGPVGMRLSLLRILEIVTAFTVGHSMTLGLASMGFVRVAERPVEVLIAGSILVSAVHAVRPLFPGREAWIAGFFGLIHGLAFAATLGRLGLTGWDRGAGVLAFNVGIETMQMVVVAAVLPSLLLLSRTRWYGGLRIGGAVAAGCVAVAWMVERMLGTRSVVNVGVASAARVAPEAAIGLFLVSLAGWYFRGREAGVNCSGLCARLRFRRGA